MLLITFCAALFADLEFAIYVGVLLSLMLYLSALRSPLVLDVKPDSAPDSYHFTADSGLPDCPQMKMRAHQRLALLRRGRPRAALPRGHRRAEPAQKHVLIVASGINFIDMAGAEMLAQEARRRRRWAAGSTSIA